MAYSISEWWIEVVILDKGASAIDTSKSAMLTNPSFRGSTNVSL